MIFGCDACVTDSAEWVSLLIDAHRRLKHIASAIIPERSVSQQIKKYKDIEIRSELTKFQNWEPGPTRQFFLLGSALSVKPNSREPTLRTAWGRPALGE
jgi:hypothetical protein